MSKTHLRTTKKNELITGIAVAVFILAMLSLNLLVLIPSIIRLYTPVRETETMSSIDTETVNRARELIGK